MLGIDTKAAVNERLSSRPCAGNAPSGRNLISSCRAPSAWQTTAWNAEDLDWLCRGFSAFLASGGKLPLERCLRLPTNERALRRARRDHWLRRAWLQVEGVSSSWRRSERLAVEVHRFHVAKWPRWSSLHQAPAEASALEEALFEAFRSHERVPGTAMQLHNIAGHGRTS